MKRFFLFILLITGFTYGNAQQIRNFQVDTAAFVNEFTSFMEGVKEENHPYVVSFLSRWKADSISYEKKIKIIEAFNQMLKRRARPEPQFTSFLKLLLKEFDPTSAGKNINLLHTGFFSVLESGSETYAVVQRAVDIALTILEDSVLYDLAGVKWEVNRDEFEFETSSGRPVVRFNDLELICTSNRDTITIFNTSGKYDLMNLQWEGRGGFLTWEKAGFDPNEVYAEFTEYNIELNQSRFEADSVLFYYKKYFDFPLLGRLEERAIFVSSPEAANHPRFFSYQTEYLIPELFRRIEFQGGLSMQGSKLVGTGSDDFPATLSIREQDTLRMKLWSKNIVIRERSMSSLNSRVKFFLGQDSIFHPDLQFIYLEDDDEIRLTRGEHFTSGVPYINSYHNVSMNLEELIWKRGSGNLRIQPSIGRSIGEAVFESDNFFNYAFYTELQGRDFGHPLVQLWQFSGQINGIREFPVTAFASNIGKPPYLVRHQLMRLSRRGFVFFDDERDMVSLNDKLFYFIEASVGKTDYDVISLISRVQAPAENASLNLRTLDLTINGIENVFLSDSQNVVLVPENKQIVMKRNSSFQFDGIVEAGLFTMHGKNFYFDYDSFKIELNMIDSLQMEVVKIDNNTGTREITQIDNYIQNLKGDLLIDKPQNKSGLEDFPDYPIFVSEQNSYVYFDKKEILGGVYDRNRVYFEVDTFRIDSLDNFTREGMKLNGRFYSAGIFPTLEQTLVLMDDQSLGFYTTAPDGGLGIYDEKGKFYDDLRMSSSGLRGEGKIEYLTSTTWSDDFTFFPDSLKAVSNDFYISPSRDAAVEFPSVKSRNNTIRWLTREDKFYSYMQDISFSMFNDSTILVGDLLLEPGGLSGSGKVDLVAADLKSERFDFMHHRILADTADFELKSTLSDKLAINTTNLRTNIDFEDQSGEFYSNEDFTLVEFPEILYNSYLDYFKWNMMGQNIEMGLNQPVQRQVAGSEDGLSGPRYYSLRSDQDSLNFVSPQAIYDYQDNLLNVKDIPYIQIADARITPAGGEMTIRSNAEIDALENATVLTDFRTRNYELFNANLKIISKNRYTGSADYNYIDLTGETQVISFSKIWVDSTLQTRASGDITTLNEFRLSPFFEFQGEARMASRDPLLIFDGGARLIHDCELPRQWLKFESRIDPQMVRIPVSEQPLTINMDPTYIGTKISRDSTHVYSVFASPRKDYFDRYISTASGFLRFDPVTQRYEVAETEKLTNKSGPGNYVGLDRSTCIVYGEGKLNLNADFGQMQMVTIGKGTHDLSRDTYETRLLMGLNFFFSEEALNEFARELDSIPGLQPMDLTSSFYKQALRDLIGVPAAERMEADLGLYGEYRNIPENFRQTLLMSDIELSWNPLTRSYRFNGLASIVTIGATQINKKAEVYLEITKRASGDLLDLYIKLNENTWYYFGYNPGSLQAVSSNRAFNGIIFDLKDNDRKLRTRFGQTGYIYSLAADRRPQLFLRRFIAGEEE